MYLPQHFEETRAEELHRVIREYPYACLEQLVSVAVALRNRDRWEAVMKHLSDYQDEDGPLLHTSSNRRTSNL